MEHAVAIVRGYREVQSAILVGLLSKLTIILQRFSICLKDLVFSNKNGTGSVASANGGIMS